MIELESSRAKRYPITANEKNSAMRSFDPRSSTGWKHSDPTVVAKMYQKTKEELEKWLHIRAALLGFDLTFDQMHILDVNAQDPIIDTNSQAQTV